MLPHRVTFRYASGQPLMGEISPERGPHILESLPFTEMRAEGAYDILSVSDDGSGISAEDLERIFEPFYTKKVLGRSGTGLDLAVVWNMVQDHDGYINVESGDTGG